MQGESVARPWQAAALWMLFLGPFFFLVYGLCNCYASRLPAVPSYFYSWEKAIPFIPAAIVPYFTIDAFYAGSVFLCRDRKELDTHAFRIIAAIVISAVGFLAFPLRFSFARPDVDGVYGPLFAALSSFDKPFNQAPSLHMSLLLILWTRYARYARGLWQPLLHFWFALIGLSVLFVYQHHVIDIWTGLIVGVVCHYALPDAPRCWAGFALTSDPQWRRLGLRYVGGAALCLLLAVILRSWGWLLLWPGISLSLVALAYFGAGPAVFQKWGGRQSRSARILLAPYLLGAWISYRLYTRAAPALHQATPGLYFGRWPRGDDLTLCRPVAVLDLTPEFSAMRDFKQQIYGNVPILDLTTPDPPALHAAMEFIDKHIQQGAVYVHCALGFSRSATVVAAWLVRSKRFAAPDEAMSYLAAQRQGVTWSPAHITAITEAIKITT